jgi:4-hydroxyphenylacetate 3-monooxygenase
VGARRGEQVIQRLKDNPLNIWHRGKQVKDLTTEPGFANGIKSLAGLYDLQWQQPDTMLFDSPSSGDKVGRSFMIPKTQSELTSVGEMMLTWSRAAFGMMGRSPDYINRSISGYAGGADFLAQQGDQFPGHVRKYHEYMRENDLCLTHTLIHPQVNRAVPVSQQSDPYIGARIKEERDDGIVIKGARMLATLPISDEIMVFPSTLLRAVPEDEPYAYGFAIPNNTQGLKFICRESVDYGRNTYDHPLGARFEEHDAVVIFDDVFVPWERVFLYRNVDICNQAYAATGAIINMSHQVVCKNIAKTEFLLGLASMMVDSIGVEKVQHIHEKFTEIWINLETMKAFRRTAEADAALNEYGMMVPAWDPLDAARNLFPRLYPRMIEIIQQLGASGLVAMPTLADVNGPLAEDIQKYYQSARLEAADRIPLFRLAWDTALSAFGTRQVLYERFFFGDPVRMAGAVFEKKDRSQIVERIQDFLKKAVEDAQ